MAEPGKSWSLEEFASAKPAPLKDAGDDAAIAAGSFTQGAREGGNPLAIAEGVLRLVAAGMPYMNRTIQGAAKEVGADEALQGSIDWLAKNKESLDPLKVYDTPQGRMIAEAFKKITGLDPRTDLASTEAAYKATGAEKNIRRDVIAGISRTVGAALPTAAIPGIPVAGSVKAIGMSAVGAGLGRAVGGETGEIVGSLVAPFVGPLTAKIATRVADAAKAGTTPTLGQATGSKSLSAVESAVGNYPGGLGVIQRKAESDAAKMSAAVEAKASELAPAMEDMRVGNLVKSGLTDKDVGFVGRFREKATELYNRVNTLVPPSTPVALKETMKTLDDALAAIPGAAATSRSIQNEALRGLYQGILEDVTKAAGINLNPQQLEKLTTMKASTVVGVGALPYEAVSGLRSAIGRRIENAGLVADLPKAELKRLYGALSADVEFALAGHPAALKAWETANGFFRAGMTRIENVIEPIASKGVPEKIMASLQMDARQGEQNIRDVMKSLRPDEKKAVSAWFLRNLGQEAPGAQNAAGTKFSVERYLTDWNKLTDGAKTVLFDSVGKKAFREDLDAFARYAQTVKEGASVLRNPSGTGRAGAYIAAGGVIGGAAMTGNMQAIGAALGTVVLANVTARMMTSPVVVSLLAKASNSAPATFVNQVMAIARNTDNKELRADLDALVSAVQNVID